MAMVVAGSGCEQKALECSGAAAAVLAVGPDRATNANGDQRQPPDILSATAITNKHQQF